MWPWNDDPLATPSNTEDEDYMQPVELGASIFVAVSFSLRQEIGARGADGDVLGQ